MRATLERTPIRCENNTIFVTASFGVAQRNARMACSDQLVQAADQALLEAKESGRNRVETGMRHDAPQLVASLVLC